MSIGISHWDFWSWLLCWLSQKNLTNTESNLHISLFTPMLFFPVIMRNCAFSYLMPILPLDFSFCFLRNPNNQGSLTFLASSLLDSSHHFKHDQFSWRYGKLWTENKEKILKAPRGKEHITYRRTKIRMTADFFLETMQATIQWSDIFKMLKGNKKHQLEFCSQWKPSFKNEG